VDPAILQEIEKSLATVDGLMKEYEFKGAVDAVMSLAAFGNTYIQTNAPWKLVRTDRAGAAQVIKNCVQIVKALALLIEPVMPDKAQECWKMLGYYDEVARHPVSDATCPVPESCLKAPVPLFAKIEEAQVAELDALLKKRVSEADKKMEKVPSIPFEEFQKLRIVTGRVLSAEPVPKSNKLLKLQVDIGNEKRQIVAGMVVISNLAPAKIFGVESNGMILAAGDQASLLVPFRPVVPGTKVR
jgi:methionyl-tRNA synthetase